MAETPARGRPGLLAFGLGTCNASLALLALLIAAHGRGQLPTLLDGLGTAPGLLLFAAFWALTWWSTAGALRDLRPLPPPWWRAMAVGIARGAIAGGVALLAIIALVVVVAVVREGVRAMGTLLLVLAIYGVLALAVAAIVGAAVGFALAVVDRLLLALVLDEG